MGTAVDGADVVREGVHDFGVGVIVHEGDVHFAVGLDRLEGDDLLVQRLEPADFIDELDELGDAAFVAVDLLVDVRQVREHFGLGFAELLVLFLVGDFGGDLFRFLEVLLCDLPKVGQCDLKTGVQEGLFSEALLQGLEVVDRRLLEDVGAGLEPDGSTGLVRIANDLEVRFRNTQIELLIVDMPVLTDFDFEPVGQSVDDGGTDAVQTAGDLVSATAELTAGVEDGQNDRDRRNAQFLVDADRDASTVVADFDDVPGQDVHFNVCTEAGQSFVDGVVDDLIDQMVESAGTGRTDVHTGTHPDRFETFEDLDLLGTIVFLDDGVHFFHVIELTDGSFLRLDRLVRSLFRCELRRLNGRRPVCRRFRRSLLGLLRSHAGVRVLTAVRVFSVCHSGCVLRCFSGRTCRVLCFQSFRWALFAQLALFFSILQHFCVHFFLTQSKTSKVFAPYSYISAFLGRFV